MGKLSNETRRGSGMGRKILKLLAWFFLLGFILNAVQLIVLIASERAGAEPLPVLANHVWVTGASAGAYLLLAIILFRNARPRA